MTLLNQNSILDYTPSQLQAWLTEQGYPGYHTRQIFQWLYQRKVTDFDDMSDLSKSLRLQLKESFYIETPPIRARQEDPGDGTVKCLFQLRDEEAVEAVLMPRYPERVKTNPRTGEIQDRKNLPVEGYTTCLSTQVGCMYACRFCASGQLGLKRNMTAGEMVAQVMAFHRQEKPVSRIVFMGTGEPLHNIDSLRRAIEILTHKDGLNFSSRRITVSTVGLVPEIYRIGREGWKVKLAISLHATTDEKRSNIMPLARAYHLDQLKDALKYYQRCNGRRISFEYLLLGGVNDSPKDAERDRKSTRLNSSHRT